MNKYENVSNDESPELDKDGLTAAQRALAEEDIAEREMAAAAREKSRDCRKEVAEFEGLVADFESQYSLDELSAITELSVVDAPSHPLRAPAQEALGKIFRLLRDLRKETDISAELHEELDAKYMRLSRAVGQIYDNNKVRH